MPFSNESVKSAGIEGVFFAAGLRRMSMHPAGRQLKFNK